LSQNFEIDFTPSSKGTKIAIFKSFFFVPLCLGGKNISIKTDSIKGGIKLSPEKVSS